MPCNVIDKYICDMQGVLLVNLGTPDSPGRWDVYRYLKQFLLDKRVIDIPWIFRNLLVRGIIAPFRSGSSSKIYKKLWTEQGSPLKYHGETVAAGVQELLGDEFHVELAMRYQNPSLDLAIDKLMKSNPEEIIVFPMFPQYASASTGSVFEEVMDIMGRKLIIPKIKIINSFCNDERVMNVFVKNAKKRNLDDYEHFVFSFHGIPHSQLRKSDTNNHCLKNENCCQTFTAKNQFCYSAQCFETARVIAKGLGITKEQYTVCFQSRLGPDKWTQPPTPDTLEKLQEEGMKRIMIFSPAFVADCLETTIEIGDEFHEEFMERGGETLDLVESLNDDPDWINAIAEMVKEA